MGKHTFQAAKVGEILEIHTVTVTGPSDQEAARADAATALTQQLGGEWDVYQPEE